MTGLKNFWTAKLRPILSLFTWKEILKLFSPKKRTVRWWKRQDIISVRAIFSRWFSLILWRLKRQGASLTPTGCCAPPIRPHICFILPAIILKLPGHPQKRWQSLKMAYCTLSLWPGPGQGERQMWRMTGLKKNFWPTRKSGRSITCL